jgi:hypothetical protein
MEYRTPPPPPPLVILNDKLVQAFDSATGRPLWQRPLPGTTTPRIASTGDLLALCVGKRVILIDMPSGRELLEVDLWFDVQAIVSHEGTIAMTGYMGLACFTSGGYAWGVRGRTVPGGGIFQANVEYTLENSRGEPMGKLDQFAPFGGARRDLGMVLGAAVFQPDISG